MKFDSLPEFLDFSHFFGLDHLVANKQLGYFVWATHAGSESAIPKKSPAEC